MLVPPSAGSSDAEGVVDACLAGVAAGALGTGDRHRRHDKQDRSDSWRGSRRCGGKGSTCAALERLAAVVVVSGRAPEVAGEMVGLAEPHVCRKSRARTDCQRAASGPIQRPRPPGLRWPRRWQRLRPRRIQAEAPWLVIENKGVTGTVHYRLAPDTAALKRCCSHSRWQRPLVTACD